MSLFIDIPIKRFYGGSDDPGGADIMGHRIVITHILERVGQTKTKTRRVPVGNERPQALENNAAATAVGQHFQEYVICDAGPARGGGCFGKHR